MGDVVRCTLVGQVTLSSAASVAAGFDFEVDRPVSADTRCNPNNDFGAMEFGNVTNRTMLNVVTIFTSTEAGVHGFRPMWTVQGAVTLTLYNGASSNVDTAILFLVENLGPVTV